jgi:PAS domain S-box-containing protein
MADHATQELENALAALRASEARYRDLFEQNLAGVYRSTVGGRVLECNAALARIFGFESPEALRAAPATDLYLEASDRQRHVERLRAHGAVHSGELQMRRRDGARIWVVYSERLGRGPDGEELIEGTLLDVTPRREAEAALLLSGRLAAAGTLAGGVAHGINNPLSAVLANVRFAGEALARLAAGEADPARRAEAEEAREALADAAQGVARVREVVAQLRSFAGEPGPEEEPVDLREVLEAALRLVAGVLRPVDRIERHYAPVPPVGGSAPRLGQALHGVLHNAARALQARGAAAGRLAVAVVPAADGRVLVTVADDGCGMSPEVLARAFDPFFTGGREGGADGVGLSLARAYVGSLGGDLALESLEGHGTTVRILLRPHLAAPDPRDGAPPA